MDAVLRDGRGGSGFVLRAHQYRISRGVNSELHTDLGIFLRPAFLPGLSLFGTGEIRGLLLYSLRQTSTRCPRQRLRSYGGGERS